MRPGMKERLHIYKDRCMWYVSHYKRCLIIVIIIMGVVLGRGYMHRQETAEHTLTVPQEHQGGRETGHILFDVASAERPYPMGDVFSDRLTVPARGDGTKEENRPADGTDTKRQEERKKAAENVSVAHKAGTKSQSAGGDYRLQGIVLGNTNQCILIIDGESHILTEGDHIRGLYIGSITGKGVEITEEGQRRWLFIES